MNVASAGVANCATKKRGKKYSKKKRAFLHFQATLSQLNLSRIDAVSPLVCVLKVRSKNEKRFFADTRAPTSHKLRDGHESRGHSTLSG